MIRGASLNAHAQAARFEDVEGRSRYGQQFVERRIANSEMRGKTPAICVVELSPSSWESWRSRCAKYGRGGVRRAALWLVTPHGWHPIEKRQQPSVLDFLMASPIRVQALNLVVGYILSGQHMKVVQDGVGGWLRREHAMG